MSTPTSPITLCALTALLASCGQGADPDPCRGVTCDHPPTDQCQDGSTLLVYGAGMCDPASGGCGYLPSEQHCAGGCQEGRCLGGSTASGWAAVLELNDGAVMPEWGSGVRAFFSEVPHFIWYPEYRIELRCQQEVAQGDCRLFASCAPFDRMCEEVCAEDQECVFEGGVGLCRAFVIPIDMGALSVTGLKAPVSLTPDTFGRYFDNSLPADLFEAGDPVAVSGGQPERFTLLARGVAHLEIASSTVDLTAHQASSISWTPADPDTRVRALLLSGWHFPYPPNAALLCEGPDAQGTLEIPAALVDGFLAHGNLLNRASHLMRYTRAAQALGEGEIELTAGSVRNLQLILP